MEIVVAKTVLEDKIRSEWLEQRHLRGAKAISMLPAIDGYRRFEAYYRGLLSLSRQHRRRILRDLGTSLAGAAMLIALGSAPAALAADIPVGGSCSLPDAILAANTDQAANGCVAGAGPDTLQLNGATIALAVSNGLASPHGPTALPLISSEITIEGGDAIIEGDPNRSEAFRLFEVTATGNLTLNDVTIRGGGDNQNYNNPAYLSGYGGAILNDGGVVTLNRSTLSGNTQGAIANQGGGTVIVNSSEISDNSSRSFGAGVRSDGGLVRLNNSNVVDNNRNIDTRDLDGAAIDSRGSGATIEVLSGSTITSNGLGGIYISGGSGSLTVTDSEISGNGRHGIESHDAVVSISGSDVKEQVYSYNNGGSGGSGVRNHGGTLTISGSNITGNDDAGVFSQDATGTVQITDTTISGNTADVDKSKAGGIHVTGSGLRLSNTMVKENAAGGGGGFYAGGGTGGVYSAGGAVVVTDGSSISDNRGSYGGIYTTGETLQLSAQSLVNDNTGAGVVGQGTAITVTDSTVSGNKEGGSSGGIRVVSGSLSVLRGTISGNTGVGIHAMDSSSPTTLIDSVISGNTSEDRVGGIYSGNGGLDLSNTKVIDNETSGYDQGSAGGIFSTGGTVNISNLSDISRNRGELAGGLYASGGTVELNGSIVGHNTGSGIVTRDTHVTITGSDVTENDEQGGYGGGGIRVSQNKLTITDSTISHNTADDGGGIQFDGDTLTMTDVDVLHNSSFSRYGGGLWIKSGTATVTDSQIFRNRAGYGGGVASRGNLTITGSTLYRNVMDRSGGGLFIDGGSATVSNTTISGNGQTDDGAINGQYGGGISLDGGTLVVRDSTITANASSSYGGGIYADNGAITLERNLISGNTAGRGGEVAKVSNGSTVVNNLFGESSQDNANAFYDFAPGANNITATSDGTDPTVISEILNETLQNNGGLSLTHLLVSGSPAIDAVVTSGAPETDQRGVARPQGSASDIGAVENRALSFAGPLDVIVFEHDSLAIDLNVVVDEIPVPDTGFTFSLVPGSADNALFEIDPTTGVISFINAPQYSDPQDAGMDNRYEIAVRVVGAGDQVASATVIVAIDLPPCEAPGRAISRPNSWYLLSLPCLAPDDTKFGDLLPDGLVDEPGNWAAWTYNALAGGYEPLLAEAAAPAPGVGFWFQSVEELELDMPFGSKRVSTRRTLPCGSDGCFTLEIGQDTNWNLLGHGGETNQSYEMSYVSNPSIASCSDESPCLLGNVEANGVQASLFLYNEQGPAPGYLRFGSNVSGDGSSRSVSKPWDGYWASLNSDNAVEHPWQLYMGEYPSQYMFVTDLNYSEANISSQSRADDICQIGAYEAGWPGSYRAWYSESQAEAPLQTYHQSLRPYIRPDGVLLASDFADLTDGALDATVSVTPSLQIRSSATVRTYTNESGQHVNFGPLGCNGQITRLGFFGTTEVSSGWSALLPLNCATDAALYCVSQDDGGL